MAAANPMNSGGLSLGSEYYSEEYRDQVPLATKQGINARRGIAPLNFSKRRVLIFEVLSKWTGIWME